MATATIMKASLNGMEKIQEMKRAHTLNWVGAEGGSIFFGPQGGV